MRSIVYNKGRVEVIRQIRAFTFHGRDGVLRHERPPVAACSCRPFKHMARGPTVYSLYSLLASAGHGVFDAGVYFEFSRKR